MSSNAKEGTGSLQRINDQKYFQSVIINRTYSVNAGDHAPVAVPGFKKKRLSRSVAWKLELPTQLEVVEAYSLKGRRTHGCGQKQGRRRPFDGL